MKSKLNRRELLKAAGVFAGGVALTPLQFFGNMGLISPAEAAAGDKKNLIIVRTLFDFRDRGATTFTGDLAPLSAWKDSMTVVEGMTANGGGSEYHNGKQIRFATSCSPTNRTNQSGGGGAYDGKSVDVVTGEHLQTISKSRHPYLILGAYPYSDASLHATFETISFANKSQYIRPEYDLASIRSQIATYAQFCSEATAPVDVESLRNENRVLESVMLDFDRSVLKKSAEIRDQSDKLKQQFKALRDENVVRINGAPTCLTVRSQMLEHSFTRHNSIPAAFDPRVREMNYTAALALKTNFTNTVTLNYNFSGHAQPNVPGFHNHTHPGGGAPNSGGIDSLEGLSGFQVQMFAHLLKELGDMNVLKDTLIVYAPHERPTHNHSDVPILAYGAKKTGFHQSNRRTQDVCSDILGHFAIPADNFGGERSVGGIIT